MPWQASLALSLRRTDLAPPSRVGNPSHRKVLLGTFLALRTIPEETSKLSALSAIDAAEWYKGIVSNRSAVGSVRRTGAQKSVE